MLEYARQGGNVVKIGRYFGIVVLPASQATASNC